MDSGQSRVLIECSACMFLQHLSFTRRKICVPCEKALEAARDKLNASRLRGGITLALRLLEDSAADAEGRAELAAKLLRQVRDAARAA